MQATFSSVVPLRFLASDVHADACYVDAFASILATHRYNSVNGVPSCANDWLLKDVARGEWSFDGYITADCDADADVVMSHHYHNDTPAEGVRDVLRAGTDVDCGTFVSDNVEAALQQSLVTWNDVDERLAMLWTVRMRLGHFDPIGPLQSYSVANNVCTPEGIELSMEGLIQSAALLKNERGRLPLSASSMNALGSSVAIVGPNANYSWGDTGYYGPGNVCGHKFWNVADAVSKYAVSTTMVPGIPSAMSDDGSGIHSAVAAAAAADTVVLVVGTDLKGAAEAHDAVNITLTSTQAELIVRVTSASKKPVIAIVMTATPLDISELLLKNDNVGAVLHVGQPSVTILGVGDLLFGKRSPAGRMVQTVYPEKYQNDISIFDFNMRPGKSAFARPDCTNTRDPGACPRGINPGRTHRFYTGKPVVPFGFGLSYTTFEYNVVGAPTANEPVDLSSVQRLLDDLASASRSFIKPESVEAAGLLVQYTINVTNTGLVDADDIVLGFMTPPGAGKGGVPKQTLFGFERVHVKAGQTVSVLLYPDAVDFTQVDSDGTRTVLAGTYMFSFGVKETAKFGMGVATHNVLTVLA
jgi:pre-mRNA-splicing factor SYF2/beta-D-xylosidase 4